MNEKELYKRITEKILNSSQEIKIVFPEGSNKKIQKVSLMLKKFKKIKVILLNSDFKYSSEQIINYSPSEEEYKKKCELLYELRKNKISYDDAKILIKNPLYFAMIMLYSGECDLCIAGIENKTADVLRPALQIIKTNPEYPLVSSCFIMSNNDEMLLFGDVALNINPDSNQLSFIAKQMADFAHNLNIFDQIKIAFLSYSTNNSGKGEDVDKVRDACKIFSQKYDYLADGEMQFDSAYDKTVQKEKYPECKLNGKANIYVFPNLNASNIGYKIAQRLGNYKAIGPIMLGIKKPVLDLSRGATDNDIYMTALMGSFLFLCQ